MGWVLGWGRLLGWLTEQLPEAPSVQLTGLPNPATPTHASHREERDSLAHKLELSEAQEARLEGELAEAKKAVSWALGRGGQRALRGVMAGGCSGW